MPEPETRGAPEPAPRPPGPARWKAPAGHRVRQSAFRSRSATGAPGFPGKTWPQSAGAPCACLGTPRAQALGGGRPPFWGCLCWASVPLACQDLEGKKRVDSFCWKKKKNLGSGSRTLPPPSPSPVFPADFVRGIRSPSRNLRGRNAAREGEGGRRG